MQRAHVRMVAFGHRDVGEVERVSRFDRAADVTLPQVHAGPLLLPLGIDEALRVRVIVGIRQAVTPRRVERDCKIEPFEFVGPSQISRSLVYHARPFRPLPVLDRLVAQHPLDARVVGVKVGESDLGRPAVVKRRLLGVDRDVGVDERSAADVGPLHHRHVREHAEVEPAVAELRVSVVPQPEVPRLARVLMDLPSPATLEDEHAIAVLCGPRRNDGAAESAADHDCIKVSRHTALTSKARGVPA
jgi:hypothetical protein